MLGPLGPGKVITVVGQNCYTGDTRAVSGVCMVWPENVYTYEMYI